MKKVKVAVSLDQHVLEWIDKTAKLSQMERSHFLNNLMMIVAEEYGRLRLSVRIWDPDRTKLEEKARPRRVTEDVPPRVPKEVVDTYNKLTKGSVRKKK